MANIGILTRTSVAPPGPRGLPLLGVLSELRRDTLEFIRRVGRQYGDLITLDLGVERVWLLNHPDHVRRVLHDNYRNYRKSDYYKRSKPLVGLGLLTSEGELWRRQRMLMQPAFRRERLPHYVATMVACAEGALTRWAAAAARGEALPLGREIMRLTRTILIRALFGAAMSGGEVRIDRALETVLAFHEARVWSLLPLPTALPTPANLRYRAALKTLNDLVRSLILACRARGTPGDDLLSLLVFARDESTGEGMSEQQLRDEVMTIFIAGHETTALATLWTLHLLSRHEVERVRLEAEIDAVLASRPPGVADLGRLAYAAQVVQESMRLYPPLWTISRAAIAEDEIGGYVIPAGTTVMICPYLIHRHPEVWRDPERFDPDRFSTPEVERRHPYAYFPFAAGPRKCIGAQLGLTEAVVLTAMICQRFRLRLTAGETVVPRAMMTLRPEREIMVELKPR